MNTIEGTGLQGPALDSISPARFAAGLMALATISTLGVLIALETGILRVNRGHEKRSGKRRGHHCGSATALFNTIQTPDQQL